MRENLLAVVVAVVMAVVFGISTSGMSAQSSAPQTWSVVAHFEYVDGTSYDYVLSTGVPTATLVVALQACGQGHWHDAGSVVRFHCYPVPE